MNKQCSETRFSRWMWIRIPAVKSKKCFSEFNLSFHFSIYSNFKDVLLRRFSFSDSKQTFFNNDSRHSFDSFIFRQSGSLNFALFVYSKLEIWIFKFLHLIIQISKWWFIFKKITKWYPQEFLKNKFHFLNDLRSDKSIYLMRSRGDHFFNFDGEWLITVFTDRMMPMTTWSLKLMKSDSICCFVDLMQLTLIFSGLKFIHEMQKENISSPWNKLFCG